MHRTVIFIATISHLLHTYPYFVPHLELMRGLGTDYSGSAHLYSPNILPYAHVKTREAREGTNLKRPSIASAKNEWHFREARKQLLQSGIGQEPWIDGERNNGHLTPPWSSSETITSF
ncbi:hypothetical protein B0H63DRAFT_478093 [Podospora didyma]|uniref:Uncharacterized protein n=1 Tax=Podospora didyma TaxID=330526 RepID=A0AAE0KJK3_9PEZI|nr:hypothetical protein B0H63DRAFT_478093 [Podospora didyma]